MAKTLRNVAMVPLSRKRRALEIAEADTKKPSRQRKNVRTPPVPLERKERRRQATPP